ncbi:hypothetical protein CoNPh17_CDS0016 [Staphylococcus phage S-CoN_Ph17]|nr:hypothetical protein CoNPh17_CDS0016 [Staphylococcus phage S-CoN_Ph17]
MYFLNLASYFSLKIHTLLSSNFYDQYVNEMSSFKIQYLITCLHYHCFVCVFAKNKTFNSRLKS